MRTGEASLTAEMAAVIRAVECTRESQPVFADAFAVRLLADGWRRIVEWAPLRWLVLDALMLGALDDGAGGVLARARFAEDALERAVAGGATQHVILGAGLDSFALRRPDLVARLRVFEVDHPASQDAKLRRLHRAGAEPGARVRFVAADLAVDDLVGALVDAGFHPGARTFFSWLGGVQYLSMEAVHAAILQVASLCAGGSELVADVLDEGTGGWARRLGAWVGEPVRCRPGPAAFEALLSSGGFVVEERLTPAEIGSRWFAGRRAGAVKAPRHANLVRAVMP